VGECEPRYATPPTPGRVNLGAEVAAAAKSFGVTLMPWQRQFADVATELFPGTHTPCYREAICTVSRQCGKTALVAAFAIHRALMWGSPQSIAYSAADGKSARAKVLDDLVPMFTARDAPLRSAITKVQRGSGSEGIVFETGSRLFTLNSSEDSGHGLTIDFCAGDEIWSQFDNRLDLALIPAMSTRPEAQVLYVSTAGHDGSAFLLRKITDGRSAIANGENTGICYVEFSADPDLDPADPATWWSCIPALGHTISEDVVRHAFHSMPLDSFRRSYLNQFTSSDERVLPAITWNAVCSENVAPDGKFVLAVDVPPDRSSASVCIADDSARVELVQQRPGLGWVVKVVTDMAKKWSADVVVDGFGPAASLVAEIEAEGVTVRSYSTREVTSACAKLYDAIADKRIEIRRHDALDLAAMHARKRTLSDSWLWGRKDSAENISPLVACTLAFDAASSLGDSSDVWAFVGPGAGEW
jgi:hypothetical protein